MKRHLLSYLALASLMLFVFSCETSKSKKLSPEEKDSVVVYQKALGDSLQKAWTFMMEDDDAKLSDLKRLIQEMEYSYQYDSLVLDTLKQELENLKAIRYDQVTVAISENIDNYDIATNTLINRVISFAYSQPAFNQYTLMAELEADILAANERVLYYRIEHDRWAKRYNAYTEENKSVFEERNPELLQKKPLFELPQ
ncbi:hypothetical protein QWY31_05700 [Cytophagales bacterium LB-30]|uniref:Lipoprotein n=1 Tax=Shiella aurantiaca TaxID=3058365 RepID=A0ABT8F3F0_9BACT|nr:hypothetical protein [Shiella aurantiaca]MDN4164986.1 hypothetical protein [Shiella aurantiaca]